MLQKLLPSVHLLELFMPYRGDEARMLNVVHRIADMDFYRGVELGTFFDSLNRRTIRNLLEENQLVGTTYTTPYIKDRNVSLSDLDEGRRKVAIKLVKQLAYYAAESGYNNFGIPSGDDPGYALRGFAKCVLAESVMELTDYCKELGLNVLLEPLDRYTAKKQLLGPMEETIVWFAPIHEEFSNIYIHWDSAHEALGGIDLLRSIQLAAPYIAFCHLSNAILDPSHPCFGDLHMDVGEAPDFETEGFLSVECGAGIIREISSYEKAPGISDTYISVEVQGHPGDNLWSKEHLARNFLIKCMETAQMWEK